MSHHTPLGEILLKKAGLSGNALHLALARQAEHGGLIGEILIKRRDIMEHDVLAALAEQYQLRQVTRLPTEFDTDFRDHVPIAFLKRYHLAPIATAQERYIAVDDPANFQPVDDLRRLLGWQCPMVVCNRQEILRVIHSAYDTDDHSATEQAIQDLDDNDSERIFSEIDETSDLLDDNADAPVIKLVNLMLSQAVRDGASDIHIEPYQSQLKIRQRLDGILYDMLAPPAHVHAALVSRIKVMAQLNIAEKRLPQDGRMEIRSGNRTIDIRVSTLPTSFGERAVLRLLHKSSAVKKLSDLGMQPDTLRAFDALVRLPHGILLITGPTGSGKTTTLYAALATINHTDKNIITVEDPIEYRIEGISQMQVNSKIGLTFASGLRTIVRQDPDVILVGEIRDAETAEIAIQSALTGHLVFSTLHTNDSASAVTRLIKMGIEPFLISSSLNAVLAQRLVRLLCPACKEPYSPAPALRQQLNLAPAPDPQEHFHRAKGCPACHNLGYQGRNGLFELMIIDDPLRNFILTHSDSGVIKEQAMASGMKTLLDDGLARIKAGATSIEEVFRVTHE